MNKALTCHGGGWGSNLELATDFKCSEPLRYLCHEHSLSQWLGGLLRERWKRGIMVKILAAPSVRQPQDIRVMYGANGVKKLLATGYKDEIPDFSFQTSFGRSAWDLARRTARVVDADRRVVARQERLHRQRRVRRRTGGQFQRWRFEYCDEDWL